MNQATTSELFLKPLRKVIVLAATAIPFQGTSSAEDANVDLEPEVSVHDQTNSGAMVESEVSTGSAIMEVRRLTGLTWEQLADVLGVARRSLHFWASGKPLNAANEERVARILACLRLISRGNSRETRALLLDPQPDGAIPLDLLARGNYEEVVARLGPGVGTSTKLYSELSREARALRRPVSPESLIGALHDDITKKGPVKTRAVRAARAKRKG